MRLTSAIRNLWVQAGISALLAALAVAVVVRSELKPLDAEQLKIQVSDMRAFAAAGEQLCEQYVHGSINETFLRNQAELIEEKAKAAKEEIETSKVDQEARPDAVRARVLAASLDAAFNGLSDGSSDAQKTAVELSDLVRALDEMEDRLKAKVEK